MANYASNMRPIGANALDPDALEQTFAARLQGPDAGFLLPFYFGAQIARQQRGQTLIDANQAANQQAAELARQEMAAEDLRSRRSLVSSLAERGFPVSDPQVMEQLGLDPATSRMAASIGNTMILAGARAQQAEREGAAARNIAEAGGQPGNTPWDRIRGPFGATPAVQAAAIRGNAETRPRVAETIGPNGERSAVITGSSPEVTRAMGDRYQGVTQAMRSTQSQVLARAQAAGGTVRERGMQNGHLLLDVTGARGGRTTIAITPDGRMVAAPNAPAPSAQP